MSRLFNKRSSKIPVLRFLAALMYLCYKESSIKINQQFTIRLYCHIETSLDRINLPILRITILTFYKMNMLFNKIVATDYKQYY